MVSHWSPRHSQPLPTRGARLTVLSAAAAAAAALGTVPAGAEPGGGPTDSGEASARVDRLYEEAERATEKYNAAAERVTALRKHVERAQDRAARGQAEVNRMRDSLASVAGTQYRTAGLDPTLALLLSTEPDAYLARAAALDLAGSRATGRLHELQRAQRALRQHRTETAGKLQELEKQRRELSRHKRTVQSKLSAARRLLNRLTPEERADRDRASRSGERPGQDGQQAAPTGLPVPASGRAGGALSAAQRALGSPYAWGQAGPSAFDCAGLTQWAYRQAGVSIPRTSQGQAHAGRRVPLSQAQPGDLVIYRADASHVAMYAGNGQVIHSPYPGAKVRYDPVNMMPVSAVTRP
ncbi:C40 family peptidase [Streptomyces alkaliterrae]|uniref:C40 family peptidase n=1 Tax=Streptomyces alkaliterrae TaxID=2213162 RepID=UPI00389A1972